MKRNPAQSGTTVYKTIEIDLRRHIDQGRWTPGVMLPSRRDLAREYSVSPLTIERAVAPMLADGTLRADDRRGTFVAIPPTSTDDKPEQRVINAREHLPRPLSSGDGFGRGRAGVMNAGTVGIVAAVPSDSQAYLILRSLEQSLSEQRVTTSVRNRSHHDGRPLPPLKDAIASLLLENIAAIVVICLDLDRIEVEAALTTIDPARIPTVCVLAGELHRPIPHVFYDNRSGGYLAAEHVIERGYREITVLAPFQTSWVTERIEGIQRAMAQADLPPNSLQVLTGKAEPWSHEDDPVPQGADAVCRAIDAGWIPAGGIIAVSDGVAFGALDVFQGLGLQMGSDFALVGFDDEPKSAVLGLTSMRPPLESMGREAARLLGEALHGSRMQAQIRLCAHLIPRASTMKRRTSAD